MALYRCPWCGSFPTNWGTAVDTAEHSEAQVDGSILLTIAFDCSECGRPIQGDATVRCLVHRRDTLSLMLWARAELGSEYCQLDHIPLQRVFGMATARPAMVRQRTPREQEEA